MGGKLLQQLEGLLEHLLWGEKPQGFLPHKPTRFYIKKRGSKTGGKNIEKPFIPGVGPPFFLRKEVSLLPPGPNFGFLTPD